MVLDEIAAERHRQVMSEGWSAEHDDNHNGGELAKAAACYAIGCPLFWPWDERWWNPKGERRNLIRAGALIVAEIERLDRLACRPQGEPAPSPAPTSTAHGVVYEVDTGGVIPSARPQDGG